MTLHPTISQALESFMYLWIGIVAYSATSFEYLKAVNFLKIQFQCHLVVGLKLLYCLQFLQLKQ